VVKLFPGLLLLYLALRRRWREVGWTLAACGGLTLLAFAVFGATPFTAFFEYQLPRLSSGEAFSFFHQRWFTVSRNLSVSGIVFKLGLLGVPGMSGSLANAVGWLYTLVLVVLIARAARQPDRSPLDEALLWMSLLCLGSLRSPFAAGIYAGFGALWLLTLLAARVERPRDVALVVLGFVLIPGGPPLPSRAADVAVALIGQILMIAIAFRAVSQSGASLRLLELNGRKTGHPKASSAPGGSGNELAESPENRATHRIEGAGARVDTSQR
jgi:hypothetical protein